MSTLQLGRLATSLTAFHGQKDVIRILNQINRIYSQMTQQYSSESGQKKQSVYTNKIVSRCMEFLDVKFYDAKVIQLAINVLMNLCEQEGSDVKTLVTSKGVLEKLGKLLRSEDEDVKEAVCKAVCSICSWCELKFQPHVECDCVRNLLDLLLDIESSIELQNCGLNAMLALIRNGARVTHVVHPLFACVARLLMTCDEDVLRNSIWVLLEMSKALTEEQIQSFIGTGICIRLVGLIQHKSTDISSLALQLLSEITAYNSQEPVQCGLLPALKQIARVRFSDVFVMHKVCSIVADVSREAPERVMKAKLIPVMVYVGRDSEYYGAEAQCNVIRAMHFLFTRGNESVVQYALQEGCMDLLLEVLQQEPDTIPKVYSLILSCIGHVLATQTSSYVKDLIDMLYEHETYTQLRRTPTSKHVELRQVGVRILFMMQCIGKNRQSSSPKSVVNGLHQDHHQRLTVGRTQKQQQCMYDIQFAKVSRSSSSRSLANSAKVVKSLRLTN